MTRVEFLTHDISVHVPHHVSSKIPWYNLRKAHASLKENWGDYMCECDFNLRMLKNIFTECHVYDKVRTVLALCVCSGVKGVLMKRLVLGSLAAVSLFSSLPSNLLSCP